MNGPRPDGRRGISLSMHPPDKGAATVSFRLDRAFTKSRGFVGLNDTAKPEKQKGAVEFRVLGDGRVLWKSKPLKGRGTNQRCEVTITGVTELKLQARAGNRNWLHAVWLDPVVSK